MIRTTGPDGIILSDILFESMMDNLIDLTAERLRLQLISAGPGRPSKYTPDFCRIVPILMAQGMSRYEVCLELGVCYDTLLNWEKEHSEFFDALKIGTAFSQGWWERQAREALRLGFAEKFSTGPWLVNMINKFGWRSANSMIKEEKSGKIEIEQTERKVLEINVGDLSDEKLDKLMVLLERARTSEGKPIAAAPVRDTVH
jgi:hypothetical protein